MGDAFLDRWSLTHVAWGYVAGRSGLITPLQWLAIHTIYEIWENSGSGSVIKLILKHEKDTWANFAGDTLSAMVGWAIGDQYK
jgi:hypothetical protein